MLVISLLAGIMFISCEHIINDLEQNENPINLFVVNDIVKIEDGTNNIIYDKTFAVKFLDNRTSNTVAQGLLQSFRFKGNTGINDHWFLRIPIKLFSGDIQKSSTEVKKAGLLYSTEYNPWCLSC